MKKKGFTIIELLAVIMIIGIVSIIGIIAIDRYTEDAEKDVYINNLKTFIKAAKDLYNSDKLAQEPKIGEVLIIPFSLIEVDESVGYKSPYGSYVLESCYIVVTRINEENTYYVVALDEGGIGINGVKEKDLHRREILFDENKTDNIKSLVQIEYNTDTYIMINGVKYKYSAERNLNPNVETFILIEV
jgi:prepilin-type N-terminal cleavage/methylation domain